MQSAIQGNDYRVEKYRTTVRLVTLAGEGMTGDVFLQPYVAHRHGPEEVIDLLNSPEPFFPVRCSDGVIRFYPKDRLVQVELEEPPCEDDFRRMGAREALVELTLPAGDSYTGSIHYEVPTARPRLLDYLNRLEGRFVLVHTRSGCRLVNWTLLDSLRPLD